MSDGNPDWPSLVRAAPAAAEAVDKILETCMPARRQRAGAKKRIVEWIVEKAIDDPGSLSETDIAYVGEVLGKTEADWVVRRFVDARSHDYDDVLREMFSFGRPALKSSDTSFDRNLEELLRRVDIADRPVVELYAQIRSGERVRPGSFSKRTCNLVNELTTRAISIMEKLGPWVVWSSSSPDRWTLQKPRDVNLDDILYLESFGILYPRNAAVSTSIKFSEGHFSMFLGERQAIVADQGSPFDVRLEILMTPVGSELMMLNDAKTPDVVIEELLRSIPASRNPRLILTD